MGGRAGGGGRRVFTNYVKAERELDFVSKFDVYYSTRIDSAQEALKLANFEPTNDDN